MNCYQNMWMEKLEATKQRSFKQQQLGTDSQMRDGGKKITCRGCQLRCGGLGFIGRSRRRI